MKETNTRRNLRVFFILERKFQDQMQRELILNSILCNFLIRIGTQRSRRRRKMKFLKAMALLITLTATTQSYAAGESCAEFLKTDKELNDTYKEIQTKYKADSIFLKKLKKAQTAWIAFRDAHLEAVYPALEALPQTPVGGYQYPPTPPLGKAAAFRSALLLIFFFYC
ncbi:MAG: DUF1311 domain-containing protein [Proteobacteria bacterium]|nr:MAG: DUF1311 domain-containing protein [Pseudomonadota bacterium]